VRILVKAADVDDQLKSWYSETEKSEWKTWNELEILCILD
jgi:hypothetical protein